MTSQRKNSATLNVAIEAVNMHPLPFLNPALFQVCYVTSDLDAGLTQLSAVHGVERSRIKRDVAPLPVMPAMTLHQAHVYLGDVLLELFQPAGGDDAVYRDLGPVDATIRNRHVGMWVDDRREYGALRARCAAMNVPVAFEIAIPDVGGAINVDLHRSLGHDLECSPGAAGEANPLRRRATVLKR